MNRKMAKTPAIARHTIPMMKVGLLVFIFHFYCGFSMNTISVLFSTLLV